MGVLKGNSDIRYLREAAKIAAEVCDELMEAVRPGASTLELERLCNTLLAKRRSSAPFKSFDGFGHAMCISLNEEIVNGPPTRERILKEGDLVSIATAAECRGLYGKIARTHYLGEPSYAVNCLLEGTRMAIPRLIEASRHARTLNELLLLIPQVAEEYGLTVIKTLGGAGIGKKLHDYPHVPNNPVDLPDVIPLEPNLAFTLMPMFTLGESGEYAMHEDGWTFVTKDGALSAHVADTLLMTENGLENLTGGVPG